MEFDAGFGALSQMLRRHAVRDPGGGTPAGGDFRVLGSVIQTKRSLTAPDFFSSRPFRRQHFKPRERRVWRTPPTRKRRDQA